MISILQAALLGLLQGITEFLPVSSSGHLVIAQSLFHLQENSLFLDTILHLGTVMAILLFFRRDLGALVLSLRSPVRLGPAGAWRNDPHFRLLIWLGIGTLPAGLAGVLFNDWFEAAFNSPRMVGFAFFITASLLFLSRLARSNDVPLEKLGWRQALIVGLAQAAAITPGVSRSGSTIVAGLLSGLDREAAGRFSFLLAIPVILGAVLLQALKVEELPPGFAAVALTGFVVSLVSGYLSLHILLHFIRRGRLHWFGVYCVLAGLFALLLMH
ncbi:MAG: undecaprenyl-diphosphate phosphatase [Myxococcales bacterium]|nr:undecaprenyl-diphosphate phosphatase [Myxococcales bacterium]